MKRSIYFFRRLFGILAVGSLIRFATVLAVDTPADLGSKRMVYLMCLITASGSLYFAMGYYMKRKNSNTVPNNQ
jgi:hypothetical protein